MWATISVLITYMLIAEVSVYSKLMCIAVPCSASNKPLATQLESKNAAERYRLVSLTVTVVTRSGNFISYCIQYVLFCSLSIHVMHTYPPTVSLYIMHTLHLLPYHAHLPFHIIAHFKKFLHRSQGIPLCPII